MLSRWEENQCLPYKECACVCVCTRTHVCACAWVCTCWVNRGGEKQYQGGKDHVKTEQNSCKLAFEGGLVFLVWPKAVAE